MPELEMWSLQTSSARSAASRAARLEAAGWHGMGVTDSQNLAGDAWVALTAAAAQTTTLGLATAVTNPVTRHPAVTAAAAASLAVIAGDRVAVGIGRGDSALAHLGRAPAPVAVLERYTAALRTYLRGEAVAFDDLGFHESMAPEVSTLGLAETPDDSRLAWLRPADRPIPVEVAATGPKVIAAAARTADRVLFALGASPERVRWGIDTARAARSGAGLDPDALAYGAYVNLVVHADLDAARGLVAGALTTFARFSVMHGTVSGPVDDGQRRVLHALHDAYDMTRHTRTASAQAQVLTDDFIDGYAVVGPPDHCIARLRALAELGITKIVAIGASPGSDREAAAAAERMLTGEVLPNL